MIFRDRDQAARLLEQKLAPLLARFSGQRPVILAIPQGGVPIAKVIADALNADIDLALVQKLTSPMNGEATLGSVTEEGDVYLDLGTETEDLDERVILESARKEISRLRRKREAYTPQRLPLDLGGRVVVIVGDGVGRGATASAAVRGAKDQGAAHVIVATPVASNEAIERLTHEGAEICSLLVPEVFASVSDFYEDFSPVAESEVVRLLAGQSPEITIRDSGLELKGFLAVPDQARGLVILAHGASADRHDARNQFMTRYFQDAGLATLLVDLLMESESEPESGQSQIDVETLSRRLSFVSRWVLEDPQLGNLPHGYFGSGIGAAAALHAASEEGDQACAVVSRMGRPEMVWEDLAKVTAPTLFIVDGSESEMLAVTREASDQMICERDLKVLHGGELSSGGLEQVAHFTRTWFERHVSGVRTRTGLVASPVSAAGPDRM